MSDFVVVWLNFEYLFPKVYNTTYFQEKSKQQTVDEIVDLCKSLYSNLSLRSSAHILWFLFGDYYVQLAIVVGHNPVCCGLSSDGWHQKIGEGRRSVLDRTVHMMIRDR